MKAGGVAMGQMATLACFLQTMWSSLSEDPSLLLEAEVRSSLPHPGLGSLLLEKEVS